MHPEILRQRSVSYSLVKAENRNAGGDRAFGVRGPATLERAAGGDQTGQHNFLLLNLS